MAVVDEVIASLSEEYGKVGEMTVRRGKKHDYLGTTLDFSEEGQFIVDMEECLDKIPDRLLEDMNEVTTTPVADHLLKRRNDAPKLNKERAELLHRVTAHILFVAQCDRPNLQTAISFLTKQVGEEKTDKCDYKKLARVAKYIRRIKFLHLTIKGTYLEQI